MELLEYSVVLDPDEEGKGYTATVPALPGCISQGATLQEALHNITEAVTVYIRDCQKHGEPIPRETQTPLMCKVTIAA